MAFANWPRLNTVNWVNYQLDQYWDRRLTDLQKNSSKLLNICPSFLDVLLDVLSCEEYQINKINIFYNISKGATCKVIYNSLSVLEKKSTKNL